MGFNTATGRAEYTAVAAQTDFDFVFKIYIDEDIIAWLTPTGQEPNDVDDLLVLGVDYTIAVNGDDGGVFTLLSAATAGDYVTLVRSLSPKRFVEYAENGDLRPAVLNADQNYQTYLVADSLTAFDKVVRLPENSQDTSGELPAPVGDAYLVWSTDGKSIINDITIPAAVTTSADSVLDAGSWSDEDEDVKVQVFTDGVGEDRTPTVYSSKHHAAKSLGFAAVSESEAWEAEAEALTALSIAMEAEDTPVNLVTSDGDGTFTYTPQAGVFSSLHWATKAATFNPALFALLTGATFTGQVKGITPIATADLTRKDYVDAGDDTRLNIEDEDYVGQAAGVEILKSDGGYIKNQCTAWVNFDGTVVDGSNHCTIRDSFNVDYVLRTSTGIFDIYFLSDMDNADYSVGGSSVDGANISASSSLNTVSKIHGATTRNMSNAINNYTSNSLHILGGKA